MQKNHVSNIHKMYLLFHACHEPPTYPLSTRRQSPRTKGHYTELKPTTMAITQKSQPWPKAERCQNTWPKAARGEVKVSGVSED